MTTKWIGPDDKLELGQTGFLILHCPEQGGNRYELRDQPARTNNTHKARLTGWCGSYNNVSTHAEGLGKVIRMARNGRALVETIEADSDEEKTILEDLGWSGLDLTS